MGTGEAGGSSPLPPALPEEHHRQTGVEFGQSQGAPLLSNKALTTCPCPPPPPVPSKHAASRSVWGGGCYFVLFWVFLWVFSLLFGCFRTPLSAAGRGPRRPGAPRPPSVPPGAAPVPRGGRLADPCRFKSAGQYWPGRAAISLSHGHLNATRGRCAAEWKKKKKRH